MSNACTVTDIPAGTDKCIITDPAVSQHVETLKAKTKNKGTGTSYKHELMQTDVIDYKNIQVQSTAYHYLYEGSDDQYLYEEIDRDELSVKQDALNLSIMELRSEQNKLLQTFQSLTARTETTDMVRVDESVT